MISAKEREIRIAANGEAYRAGAMTDDQFGRLTLIEKISGSGRARWRCLCLCGNRPEILEYNIKSGRSRSCGCATKEKKTTIKPEYTAWLNMKARCSNPRSDFYPRYGGRGISVCDRWRNSFKDFLSDMGERPDDRYSLDRHPNKNGNYEPGNVRWATSQQQANNRSNNRIVLYRGSEMTLTEAARLSGTGLNEASIRYRIDELGWDIAKALEAPSRYRRAA